MIESSSKQTAKTRPTSWVEGVAGLAKRLCVSVSNCLMYSPSHPAAERAIADTSGWLIDLLSRRRHPITVNVNKDRILFEGLPLEERNPLVSRLARFLEEVNSNDLTFHPGLSPIDVFRFHTVLAQGAEEIMKQGGLSAALKAREVANIKVQESHFVLVKKNQRVVSADAEVRTGGPAKSSSERNFVNYLSEAVLKETRDRAWLLREIKDDPEQMAHGIVKGIEVAIAEMEQGSDPDGQGMRTLMENIETLGRRLTQEMDGGEETMAMDEAIGTIERELRARSGQLTSSKVAQSYVSHILSVLTSVSDLPSDRRACDGFLQGEHGLNEAERLLRSRKPREEQTEVLPPPASRTTTGGPVKTFDLGAQEDDEAAFGIEIPLDEFPLEQDERVAKLLEDSLREKDEEFARERRAFERRCASREAFLDKVFVGIVISDPEGQIDFINQSARTMLTDRGEVRLRPELLIALGKLHLPVDTDSRQRVLQQAETEAEKRLIHGLQTIARDEKGKIIGFVLRGQQTGRGSNDRSS